VTRRDTYLQGPGLAVTIGGAVTARRYFRKEYGGQVRDGAERALPVLDACFARPAGASLAAVVEGRHKLARWHVSVATNDDDDAIRVRAHVQGPFGLPLVQSLVVEPLIGVAASRHGLAMVPGALLLDGEGAGVLLVGGSGAGKTSLAARAIAAGLDVLADDRAFVDAGGTGSCFVRRMRLYPDIRDTAPRAWAALARGPRARLRAVAALREVSRGRFAPPVAVARRQLGAPARPQAGIAVSRIVLLGRHDGSSARIRPASDAAAADEIARRIRDDRAALDVAGLGEQLRTRAQADREVLEPAIRAATVQRLDMPLAWPAARAVQRLASELGLP
jgi:hypothetical protein